MRFLTLLLFIVCDCSVAFTVRQHHSVLFQSVSTRKQCSRLIAKPPHTTASYEEFVPPTFVKTEDEKTFLEDRMKMTFLFQDLPDDSFETILSAFEKVTFPKGSIVVNQGDTNADYMYVVKDGKCTVTINGKILPRPYGIMKQGTLIGELALLNDNERAATITAKTDTTMFRLDRSTFMHLFSDKRADIRKELEDIDKVIDKAAGVQTLYGGTIVKTYKPRRRWLWGRWSGTILQQAWRAVLGNMLFAVGVALITRPAVGDYSWQWLLGVTPDQSNPLIARIAMFGKAWKYMISVTTFVLTFFLSQSYGFWKEMYNRARKIQHGLSAVGILLATSAQRDEDGRYTPEAKSLLDDVGSFSRLYHSMLWAQYSKPFHPLITDRGLNRMLSRGLLTPKQYRILLNVDPHVGVHNAVLEWLYIRIFQGLKNGKAVDRSNHEALAHTLYHDLAGIRGNAAGVGDAIDGRIPLAYAHFVQILVDSFLVTAPVALYAELGVWSIVAVGILTLFYSGILDLAKILLDPLDNDEFYRESVNMDIGVLIRETNVISNRWKLGAEALPF